MKKVDMRGELLTKDLLVKSTGKMTSPCIFTNFLINQKLESCTVEEMLTLQQKEFISNVHNGSYWADKPLYSEVQGRGKKLNLESMFIEKNGDYYVTYFQPSTSGSSKWKTVRTCGNNDFDDFLAERTDYQDYMNGSVLHNHWISNGKTLSSLHSDPIDTLFVQVQGTKTFRMVPESMLLSLYVDLKQPHKLKHTFSELKAMGVKVYEFEVLPGMAVYMPAWCFHEIESQNEGLNISLTSHYPRATKTLKFSPFQMVNKIRRFWYPKLVRRKRVKFQLDNLTKDAIPFFPWFSAFLKNESFNKDSTHQHKYFITNRLKGKLEPISNESMIKILEYVDGYLTISDLSTLTGLDLELLLDIFKQLIKDQFIQILFDADDRYNYFYQNIEPKRL